LDTKVNKIYKCHQQRPGRPPFSTEKEQAFASYIEVLSDFGFPVMCNDPRHVIKSYVDRAGQKEKLFSTILKVKIESRAFKQNSKAF
jgi:hypothetical protein